MKTTEKILTIKEVEESTGVHYTLNHTGKMSGMQSLSTSCLNNQICMERAKNKESVCSHCYAQRQMKMYKALEKYLRKNTEILTGHILTDMEVPLINAAFFRFESFGDLSNGIQVQNYFNIARKNKHTKFALWTKNPQIIEATINSGVKKPSNLQIIYSSSIVNVQDDVTEKYPFVDKIFTVYSKDYIKENEININCGAKSCLSCHKCYTKSKEKYIREKLK